MSPYLTREEHAAKIRAHMKAIEAPPPLPNKWVAIGSFRFFTRINSQVSYRSVHFDRSGGGFEAFLEPEVSDDLIAKTSRQAMAASRFITPDDPDYGLIDFGTREEDRAFGEDLKRRAKVRSVKALFACAGSVTLRLREGVIDVEPWGYRGNAHWGSVPGHVNAKLPEDASDAELGAAINAAIAVSRTTTADL